jgi:hypothetical protein
MRHPLDRFALSRERFQSARHALAKTGIKIPLPTGN